MRIWHHLMLLKRAGRGHDPLGVSATASRECAVECPACPHPDRNLPKGWEGCPEHKQYVHLSTIWIVLNVNYRWLYHLLLTIDANFRFKNKDRPGVKADTPLGDGW